MAFTKLSAEDKQAIVQLYQEVGQTAATVAKQFSVSVSTISRLLKSELPPETYEALVRQKRGGGETKSKKRTSRKKPASKLKKSAAPPAAKEDDSAANAVSSDASAVSEPEAATSSDEAAEVSKLPATRSRRRSRKIDKKKRPVSRRRTKEPVESVADDATEQQLMPEGPSVQGADEVDNGGKAKEIVVAVEAATDVGEAAAQPSQRRRRTRPRLKPEAESKAENASADSEAAEADLPASQPIKRRTRRRTRTRAAVTNEKVAVDDAAVVSGTDASEGMAITGAIATEETDDVADMTLREAVEVAEQADIDLTLDDLDEGSREDEDFEDVFEGEDELDEDEGSGDNITSLRRRSSGADVVQIQPLSEANLSRMLYLVIDRTADLITMPMVFFSDLGQLPEEEEEKKTLPVFENHRVARRFSQRNQRVIKVPDGELISKTAAWLEAKGITRCLLDGQVYSLESEDQ